jgi:hypothetical protein
VVIHIKHAEWCDNDLNDYAYEQVPDFVRRLVPPPRYPARAEGKAEPAWMPAGMHQKVRLQFRAIYCSLERFSAVRPWSELL